MVYVAGLDYHKGEHITIHRDCCSPWRYFTTQLHLPRLALVYPIPRRNLIILSTHTHPLKDSYLLERVEPGNDPNPYDA